MTQKRLKYRLLSYLRSIGMLCKKPVQPSKRIRVSKTIFPNGQIMEHDKITQVPENKNSLESEIHVWKEIHKENTRKNKNQIYKK